ncbi:MAG: hypothetical protein FJ387_11265 [Verrucomicrobia bacterium]|nr:hypothetical protein [Verrucomicrobiota bacterium]
MSGHGRGPFWAVATQLVLAAGLHVAGADAPTLPLRLDNEHCLVEISSTNGAILRVRDRQRNLELLQEPRLADNFKFTLPIRRPYAWQSTEGNYVLGRAQRLTAQELAGAKLRLQWGPPLESESGQRHNVAAVMTIELAGAELRFGFRLHNSSELEIGEVHYPILGGMLGLGNTPEARRQTELIVPEPLAVRTVHPFHTFANMSWLGIFGPEQFYSYPDRLAMPWLVWHQPQLNRSVYLGAHDPVARCKVIHLELLPGIAPGRLDGNWPRPEELGGAPVGVKFCFVQFPYEPAGRDFEATPVVLRFHDGDWRQGARVYGAWLRGQGAFEQPQLAGFHRTTAYQQCEGVPFKDLVQWAKAGAAAGVQGLLLKRWSTASGVEGLPLWAPDPRLGTREELAAALRECHALGVKVAVGVNLEPTSQLTDEFKAELHRYVCQDRWAIPYTRLGVFEPSPLTGGFGAGERRVFLNPAHPDFGRDFVRQVRALAELGVDGIHLEAFFGTPLDFNPGLGRTPDRASWEGGLECLRGMLAACRDLRPGFALSSEMVWDRLAELISVASAEARELCALRTALPAWQSTFTLVDEDGFGSINSALRYRAKLRVAPADGQPLGGGATAGIVDYLRAMLTAQGLLRHTLIDGEPAEVGSVAVTGGAAVSVFRNAATGLGTAVLVNPRATALAVGWAGFVPSRGGPTWLWLPARGPTQLTEPAQIEIPGRQLALVTQEPAAMRLPVWEAASTPGQDRQVVFEFASVVDLEGWTLTGAFSVATVPGLVPKPTLNSLAAAGEAATGTALSPAFSLEPRFDHLEVLWQGGWSETVGGRENLALQLLEAKTGVVLRELVPPGTHELRTERVSLEPFRGQTVRVRLVDDNRKASYAWVGLRKLLLSGPTRPAPK